jgi:hypothetical protein
MRYFLITSLITLCGCAVSPEERAQDAISTYGPTCEKQGHAPNTDAWRRCIQAQQGMAENFRRQEAEVVRRRGIYCLDPIASRSGRC